MAITSNGNATPANFGLLMRQDEFSLLNGRPLSSAAPVVSGLAAGSEAVGLFPTNSVFAQMLRDQYSNAQALQPFNFNSFVADANGTATGTNAATVNFTAPGGQVLTAAINTIWTAATAGDVVRIRFVSGANTDEHINKLLQHIRRAVQLYYPTLSGGAGISLVVQGGTGATFSAVTVGYANSGVAAGTQCTATNCNSIGW